MVIRVSSDLGSEQEAKIHSEQLLWVIFEGLESEPLLNRLDSSIGYLVERNAVFLPAHFEVKRLMIGCERDGENG